MSLLIHQYWPMLVPTLLGFAAIYLLLPRARRLPPLYGAVAAALALFAAGVLLVRSELVLVETILFYIFAGLAILFGGSMITQRNPVHAALSFAMVVLSTCGLFLLQAAPFLMAATIIIYAGAIIVTFLFVIMLAQQAGLSSADQRSREPFLATVAAFVLLGSLLCVLHKSYAGIDHFVARAEQAAKASTVKEWQEIFGKDDSFFVDFRNAVRPTREHHKAEDEARKALSEAIRNAQFTWNTLKPPEGEQPRNVSSDRLQEFKEQLTAVCRLAGPVRHNQGSLQPAAQPLSNFSGTPASSPPKRGQLPAANVAGLGKALFTDYLLAVELAGTLLLVATIGAIAIAGRRTEGLR
jgi:NADH:ubiquinone oxidoreductase subunit 6 (subunit J)